MVKINANYNKLVAGYLFPEIAKRVKKYQEENPDAKIMRLGIGDTTEHLTDVVIEGLHKGVDKLSKNETYSGYADGQGDIRLREEIVKRYKRRYGVNLDVSEIFVSDGAKSDSSNIQSIFDQNSIVAIQDPAYPVYVDSNVIAGRTDEFDKEKGLFNGLYYMQCTKENGFFPKIPDKKVDLIYLCSPNNPTGTVPSEKQLKEFVDYAIENKSIIIFDSAYAEFITEEGLIRSIYEIGGAKKCAIEITSLSKSNGFTGVRLGWTIVPKECVCEDGNEGKLNSLWNRRQSTMFNGASNIVQEGAIAAVSEEGDKQSQEIINYYMENARIIKQGLDEFGIETFGGKNAPYVWMRTPNNMTSWEFFDKLLNETHVVGTPGSGFGPSGEGYFRLSAFGHREDILRAVKSIKENLNL